MAINRERLSKLWYSYILENKAAIKKNEISLSILRQKGHQDIVLMKKANCKSIHTVWYHLCENKIKLNL